MEESQQRQLLEFLARLTHGLAEAIGNSCEVVLHDFADPAISILAIANGHVTGRKVGDTVDMLGLQVLRNPPQGDLINYRTATKAGKILRSSSIFFRDDAGKILGALCINYDITNLVKLQEWLRDAVNPGQDEVHENFEHSVESVLDGLVQEAIRSTGKAVPSLTREDKISIVDYLEGKGAFLIRYSVERIAEQLGISKFTIYNYLEEIKARHANVQSTTTK